MKKLITAFSTAALIFVGLASAAPAQAWPDYTVPASRISIGIDSAWTIPIGKTVNSDAVFVYAEQPNDSSARYLRSYTVSPTGTITGPTTIITNSTEANYMLNPRGVWVDANSKFNLVFWSWGETNAGLESYLYHVNSTDGLTWSTPEVLEHVSGSTPECQSSWCGIRSAQVAYSPTGTAALTYTLSEGGGTNKLIFRTKKLGKTWSPKGVLNVSSSIQDSVVMRPLGSGWLAVWGLWNSNTTMYSAYSLGDTLQSWTAPQLRESSICATPRNVLQISPTKLGLVYVTECQEGSAIQIYKYQPFDVKTKRFGTAVTLDTVPATGWSTTYQTDYLAGQSAFAYSIYAYGQGETGYAKYVLFRNGVPSVQFVNQAAAVQGGTQVISGIAMDPLGHLTVVWTKFAGQTIAQTISQFYRGNRSDTDAPIDALTSGEFPVVFSPDGDVYISRVGSNHINAIARIRSDAPDLDGAAGIAGSPKVNASVKAKLPSVSATQPLQRWTFSYQWISCQYQVPEASRTAPVSCNDVPYATTSTYKVKSADKGRFLVLRLTVKSDNTTQVLYSPSTLVVK